MKSLKITLLLFVGVLIFNSCKNYETDILGTWNFQTFDNSPQGSVTWAFKDDGILIRTSSLSEGINFDTCNYSIDKNLFKKHLIITNSKDLPGLTSLNGKYKIE